MSDDGVICSRCKRPLIEIDHYPERLIGCLECIVGAVTNERSL
jgi:hypothetical protein